MSVTVNFVNILSEPFVAIFLRQNNTKSNVVTGEKLETISSTFYACILTKVLFCQNVTKCQFHQHYTYDFFIRMLIRQLFLVTCTQKKLLERCLYEKHARIMLMKLTADKSTFV